MVNTGHEFIHMNACISYKILQFGRIDASEGMEINKTDASKDCHYWYFKDIGYKFEPHICNGSHDTIMMAFELKNKLNMM